MDRCALHAPDKYPLPPLSAEVLSLADHLQQLLSPTAVRTLDDVFCPPPQLGFEAGVLQRDHNLFATHVAGDSVTDHFEHHQPSSSDVELTTFMSSQGGSVLSAKARWLFLRFFALWLHDCREHMLIIHPLPKTPIFNRVSFLQTQRYVDTG